MTSVTRDAGGTEHLVPTERHVELAMRAGGAARTTRAFVQATLVDLFPELRIATAEVTALAARAALDDLPRRRGGLSAPAEPAARVAFAHAVDRSIGRLRRAGVSPARLRASDAPRAHLLADVLQAVDRLLERRGLVDPRGGGAAIAARLRSGGAALRASEIVVTGICALHGDDLEWMEAVHGAARAAGGRGLRLALPRFAGEGDPMEPIADAIERRWASLDDAPEIEWDPAASPELAVSEVIDAASIEAEARAAAAAVLGALAAGAPPERIAVLVPDLEEAALEPLRGALADAGVAFAEPRGRPVGSSPEARAAFALVSIAAGPVTREQLIELLRAPGVHSGWWTEKSSELEASERAAELARRLRDLPVGVDRSGGLFLEALRAEVIGRARDAWMPRALERLLASAAALRGERPRRDLGRALLALFETLKLGSPSIGEIAATLKAEGRGGPAGGLALAAMGEGAAALRRVREAVLAIANAADDVELGSAPVSIAELAVEIEHALAAKGSGSGGTAARAGAVRIARAAELCALEHDLVVVTRLSAGAYGVGSETDPLLDERLAADLPEVCRPAGARERETWRRAELAWALAGARRVVLTRSAVGDEPELGPHHPLARAALDRGAAARSEPASRLVRHAARVDARAAELTSLAAGTAPPAAIATRAAIERARTSFFLDPGARPGAFTGHIAAATDAEQAALRACVGGVLPERSVAVTAIERAAGCAFAGFAGRVLRIRRGEDVAEAAGARDRGTLVHRALHAAFEGARAADAGADLARALAAARTAAERALRLVPGAGPLAPPALAALAPLRREAMEQAIEDALAAVAFAFEQGSRTPFALAEQRFGGATGRHPEAHSLERWSALELPDADGDGEGSVFVDGQIDRVDLALDRQTARVVDYKTGKLPSLDEHGRSAFQLPLYAAVVARTLGAPVVEAVYLQLRPGGAIMEHPREAQQRSSPVEREAALAAARRRVLALWRGEIEPRPSRDSVCARCDARDVCRRPAVMPIDEDEERS